MGKAETYYVIQMLHSVYNVIFMGLDLNITRRKVRCMYRSQEC